ncbi:uncharacterized protein MEP-1 isoform X4 [Panulirus ornatus]|uniref:uncharacterized protein MEP-1 isoform X4 n=1 Tax=Panulirus ornatus TaxID=150431 RepID=UPI003A8902F2
MARATCEASSHLGFAPEDVRRGIERWYRGEIYWISNAMSESEATAGLEESSVDGDKVKAINGMKEMEEEVKLQNGESEKPQINGDIEKSDDFQIERHENELNEKPDDHRHKDGDSISTKYDGVVTERVVKLDCEVSNEIHKENKEEKEEKTEQNEETESVNDKVVKEKEQVNDEETEKDDKEKDVSSQEKEKDKEKEKEKEEKKEQKEQGEGKEKDEEKKEKEVVAEKKEEEAVVEKKEEAVVEKKEEEKKKEVKTKESTNSDKPKTGKRATKDTSTDDIQEVKEVPVRETRQLRVRKTPKKYTEDDDDIKITNEVIRDDSSDIEMIEESDPLAISDADVKKLQQRKKEVKTKDPNVIIIDTNTLLKNQGNLAAAVAQSSSTPVQTVTTARGTSTPAAAATAVSNLNIQNAIQAITGGVPAQGLQSAYITALQQVSQKVLLAQGGQVPMNSQHLAQLQQYYNSLGHLQDDAYVIEAPSFIVPYVMEGKPQEPIKTFLRRINKDLEEFERKQKEEEEKKKAEEERIKEEKEKLEQEKKKQEEEEEKKRRLEAGEEENKDKEEEEKEDEKMEADSDHEGGDTSDKKKGDKESDVESSEKKEVNGPDKDEEVEVKMDGDEKPSDKDETETKEKDCKEKDSKEKEKETKKESKDKEKSIKVKETEVVKKDKETSVDDDDKENKDKSDAESVVDVEKENKNKEDLSHLGKWEPYYRSALGKFMLDLGLNQAQEFLQNDLLRMQKRKLDKMKSAPSREGILSIRMLEKQLEFTRGKNAHLHVPLKICKFCNFKTESEMVMDRHLESPHMVNYTYKCNFCDFETRGPQVILFHMEAEHNVRGRLERAPAFFQCALCPYEDNNKSKMTRHSFSCSKKYKPEKNCELADWEPPAKIPKVLHVHRGRPNTLGKAFEPVKMPNLLPKSLAGMNINIPSAVASNLMTTATAASVAAGRGRGRPVGSYKNTGPLPNQGRGVTTANSGSLLYTTRGTTTTTAANLVQQVSGNAQQFTLANQMFHLVNGHLVPMSGASGSVSSVSVSSQSAARVPRILPSSSASSVSLIPTLGASSSITIQSVQSKAGNTKSPQQPSISITPLPRAGQQQTQNVSRGNTPARDSSGKPSFVICEICDGYIKDLEQLRNHMNLIHKVKIHPKMIYNRPPLNCQKCQHRFFTDQGLERHLLGTHGLVTSSMQEAANKGKDAGRCPICGKVFQWKLLNHVSKDHKMTLKPAHLSYKCTVCTATFNMYRLFENHVYSAHSVVNKNKGDGGKKQGGGGSGSSDSPLKINDEITIIPQPAVKTKSDKSGSSGKKSEGTPTVSKEITITKVGSRPTRRSGSSVEVISLDESPSKKAAAESRKRSNKESIGNGSKKARTSS